MAAPSLRSRVLAETGFSHVDIADLLPPGTSLRQMDVVTRAETVVNAVSAMFGISAGLEKTSASQIASQSDFINIVSVLIRSASANPPSEEAVAVLADLFPDNGATDKVADMLAHFSYPSASMLSASLLSGIGFVSAGDDPCQDLADRAAKMADEIADLTRRLDEKTAALAVAQAENKAMRDAIVAVYGLVGDLSRAHAAATVALVEGAGDTDDEGDAGRRAVARIGEVDAQLSEYGDIVGAIQSAMAGIGLNVADSARARAEIRERMDAARLQAVDATAADDDKAAKRAEASVERYEKSLAQAQEDMADLVEEAGQSATRATKRSAEEALGAQKEDNEGIEAAIALKTLVEGIRTLYVFFKEGLEGEFSWRDFGEYRAALMDWKDAEYLDAYSEAVDRFVKATGEQSGIFEDLGIELEPYGRVFDVMASIEQTDTLDEARSKWRSAANRMEQDGGDALLDINAVIRIAKEVAEELSTKNLAKRARLATTEASLNPLQSSHMATIVGVFKTKCEDGVEFGATATGAAMARTSLESLRSAHAQHGGFNARMMTYVRTLEGFAKSHAK